MKKHLVLILSLASVILFSCQKEVDFANGSGGGGGGTSSGNLLVRAVAKQGNDSTVTVYTYNANKKVINEKTTGLSNGVDATNEYRYYRNASGIITHYTQINPNLAMAGIDSVVSYLKYNTASSRYTARVTELSLFGFSVLDSAVLVYDGGGKVIEERTYQGMPSFGMPYELTAKTKYTYGGSNLTQFDMYSHDASTGTDDLIATYKYTYDTKVSPFNWGMECFAIMRPDLISANNQTRLEFIDPSDPSNNETFTLTYTYNSSNKPSGGTMTQTSGPDAELRFYYQ